MQLVVNLTGGVDEGEVVFVHHVLENEVEKAKWGDERAGEREHDHQCEDVQYSSVLVTESELVPTRLPDGRCVRLTAGETDLQKVVGDIPEPHQLQSRPYQGGGDHVVDEESINFKAEDALPVHPLPLEDNFK